MISLHNATPAPFIESLQLGLVWLPAGQLLALGILKVFGAVLATVDAAVDEDAPVAIWLAVRKLGQLLADSCDFFFYSSLGR